MAAVELALSGPVPWWRVTAVASEEQRTEEDVEVVGGEGFGRFGLGLARRQKLGPELGPAPEEEVESSRSPRLEEGALVEEETKEEDALRLRPLLPLPLLGTDGVIPYESVLSAHAGPLQSPSGHGR